MTDEPQELDPSLVSHMQNLSDLHSEIEEYREFIFDRLMESHTMQPGTEEEQEAAEQFAHRLSVEIAPHLLADRILHSENILLSLARALQYEVEESVLTLQLDRSLKRAKRRYTRKQARKAAAYLVGVEDAAETLILNITGEICPTGG